MNIAHKESEKFFLLSEMRHASAFNVVDDESGAILGTAVSVMEADANTWSAFFTDNDGVTFHPTAWNFREFPLPPTLIQTVDRASEETKPDRIADLRLVLDKWRQIVTSN